MMFRDFFEKLPDTEYHDVPHVGPHYFASQHSYMQQPDRCFVYLKKYLPPHIKEVLDLGCGNGRNSLPFETLERYGIDVAPQGAINWAKRRTVAYKSISMQDFSRQLESNPDADLSKTLVISSGSFMYITAEEQQRFYKVALDRSCRNFIFQEYIGWTSKHRDLNFKLPTWHFIVKRFRDHKGFEQPVAFVRLDISEQSKIDLGRAKTNALFAGSRAVLSDMRASLRRLKWQVAGALVRARDRLKRATRRPAE